MNVCIDEPMTDREVWDSYHVVQIYPTEAALVSQVGTYLAAALLLDDVALVVATPEHRAAFAAELARRGMDLAAARDAGRYVEVDAAALLASFFVEGRVDPAAFRRSVGGLVTALARRRGGVHIYGEMVACLLGRGDPTSAASLEAEWNELARAVPFRLYCAYSRATTDATPRHHLAQLEQAHTEVLDDGGV